MKSYVATKTEGGAVHGVDEIGRELTWAITLCGRVITNRSKPPGKRIVASSSPRAEITCGTCKRVAA